MHEVLCGGDFRCTHVAELDGDLDERVHLGEATSCDAEQLKELSRVLPCLAFRDVGRYGYHRPPQLVGQSEAFLNRATLRNVVDERYQGHGTLPDNQVSMTSHPTHGVLEHAQHLTPNA